MSDTPADTTHPQGWTFETTAVQSSIPRGLGQTIGFPIHAAAAFQFDTLEEAQLEFQQNSGLSYARLQNPTVRALEDRIIDRKSTRLNSSHVSEFRMPSSA